MWHGVSAFFFSHCITNIHSHNTMQIIVDIQGSFKCKIGDGQWKAYKNLIIRENVIHQLNTNDSVQLLIYLDSETTVAKEIKSRYMDKLDMYSPDINIFKDIDPKALQQAILKPDQGLLLDVVNRVLNVFCGTKDASKADERISKARQLIAECHPSGLSVAYLANLVCLSESRLRVLFKAETGIPVYQYIMWSRIRFAINRIMNGCAVNEAALEAGFTDSSHFHKMLVKMFGLSPSQFIKSNQQFNIITCDQITLEF
ncbi:MAG: Helix-turn-helix, AraC domain protein [Mucilaginibacter sp.]|nr:Helix-turn-helix, AraC domain protein [Mucilaginibacter sp.]